MVVANKDIFQHPYSEVRFKDYIRDILLWTNPIHLFTFGRDTNLPERNILVGYLAYMAGGFLLLSLPWARCGDTGWIDTLFTAVSAVSTTGLATVDIPASYTIFGQCVILFLIQIGGIGYMTMSSYILFRMTRHAGYTGAVMSTAISRPHGMPLHDLVTNIVHFSFAIELCGFLSFFFALQNAGSPLPGWNALFLSVSSFCTAGFSPFGDSLCGFSDNLWINATVAALSYAGAMGFIVMTDITYKIRKPAYSLTFTTKVILLVTATMTAAGTIILYFSPAVSGGAAWYNRILHSFFQTMSAMTTVGFNTVDLSTLRVGPILVFSFIMFVGASPSGTGGGVKCTSLSAVYGFIVARLGIRRKTTFLGREIPYYRVESALTNVIAYGTMIFAACVVLSYSEPFGLSRILFEAASAIGTVGLSTGITPQLSVAGKITVIILMYVGRVGVITFGTALVGRLRDKDKTGHTRTDLVA